MLKLVVQSWKSINNQSIINYQSLVGKMEERSKRGRYLDVSEYMLKEFSPVTRAVSADSRHPDKNYHQERYTPQIAPIDHDPSTLKITPFLNGLIELADAQLDDFRLDSDERPPEPRSRDKNRIELIRPRGRSNSLVLMHFQNELEGIVEQSDAEPKSAEESKSELAEVEEEQDSLSQHYSSKMSEINLARMRTQSEYQQKMDKYAKEPKLTLIKDIKRIANTKGAHEEIRLQEIKDILMGYIVDFQVPCFQEAWEESSMPFFEKIELICKGVDQSFRKKIGELTFEARRMKLLKYLQKKKMRKWRKKVSYDCRKKVADSRLRIKGKFVTRQQVREQLGITDIDMFTGQEIRELLQRKKEDEKQKCPSQ